MSKVSTVKCGDYNPARVEESVRKALKLLGGLEKIVKEGDKVLLKLNLTYGREPEKAATTHPRVVRALVKVVKECGGIPMLGDSSGSLSISESRCEEAIEEFGWKKWGEIRAQERAWPELLEQLDLEKEIISKIIKEAYDPLQIPTIRVASQRRLGEANLGKIEIAGERIEEVRIDNFIHPAKREPVEKAHRNE